DPGALGPRLVRVIHVHVGARQLLLDLEVRRVKGGRHVERQVPDDLDVAAPLFARGRVGIVSLGARRRNNEQRTQRDRAENLPRHKASHGQMTPSLRQPAITTRSYPSSPRIESVCSPTPGTAPIAGSTESIVTGGARARSAPAGESISRHRPRTASCGWAANSSTVLRRAWAMSALSSLATTSAVLSFPNTSAIAAPSASRCSTRAGLVANRGSSATLGWASTSWQNRFHSRSFWIPR